MPKIAPTVMVAVEAVYGILGAIAPLRAMLYVPGGRAASAEGLCACPAVYIRKALLSSGGACVYFCLH
jgi:hypothetical protein